MSLNLVNVKLHHRGRIIEGGIHIADGRIKKLGKAANLPGADQTINGHGFLAIPGPIDVHTHLRDMELSAKEDFYSGTCAAAAGGYTTVLDMPNTVPPTTSARRLEEKAQVASKKVVVNVGFHAAGLSDEAEMCNLAKAGAFSFKLYLLKPIDGLKPEDDNELKALFSTSARLEVPVTVHAEDGKFVEEKKLVSEKPESSKSFLEAHGPEAEERAVDRVLRLATSGCQIHFCHVSAERTVRKILAARKRGRKVTMEVTPHHMLLSSRAIDDMKGVALTVPPVRKASEARALWSSFRNGKIDLVASDHAPHTMEEKSRDSLWATPPGIPGLETTLPLLLTRVNSGQLSLERFIESVSRMPAEIFSLKYRGSLSEGSAGDVTLINLRQRFVVKAESFYSKAKHSPFDGFQCKGRPVRTIVGGVTVMEDDEVVGSPGSGRVLRARSA